ncbi:hypothetical protein AL509_28810 [Achromobacter xylosoxidans]|nr:hypothetical protein AL509_28810 [Achromobacter xylosoxidans]
MTSAPNLPRDPLDAAAYWFARDHGGLMTDGERRQFEAWRQADAAHERAYQQMQQVWRLTQRVPDRDLRPLLSRRPAPPPVSPQRRRLAWAWPPPPAPPPPPAWRGRSGGHPRRCSNRPTPPRAASAARWRCRTTRS